MSRIGKLPITVPSGIEIKNLNNVIHIKGPKGELEYVFPSVISVEITDGIIHVSGKNEAKQTQAHQGTTRALLANMIKGVSEGFKRELEVVGVGYKAVVEGKNLKINVGFSHPVYYPIVPGIEIKAQEGKVEISGISKELVGKAASEIRKIRKCNPYSGKGIKYAGEKVRRKAGKAAKTGSAFGAK